MWRFHPARRTVFFVSHRMYVMCRAVGRDDLSHQLVSSRNINYSFPVCAATVRLFFVSIHVL